MDIRVFPTEELDAATRRSIIDLCIAAHNTDAFENLFSFVPAGGRHFLAYRDGDLVSHAVVTTRWAQPHGCNELRTAYVDAVSTLPSCQGLGFGSGTMRRLAETIDDYEIAALETDKPGFYSRLGWELWRGALAGRSANGLVPTPDQQGVMVLRTANTPPIDIDTEMTIECQPARIW
jgi:aminoglycoside 2'-N-acetyltransferase I